MAHRDDHLNAVVAGFGYGAADGNRFCAYRDTADIGVDTHACEDAPIARAHGGADLLPVAAIACFDGFGRGRDQFLILFGQHYHAKTLITWILSLPKTRSVWIRMIGQNHRIVETSCANCSGWELFAVSFLFKSKRPTAVAVFRLRNLASNSERHIGNALNCCSRSRVLQVGRFTQPPSPEMRRLLGRSKCNSGGPFIFPNQIT